jgi:hypothetical protein
MRTRKAAIPSVAVTSDGTVGVFYYTFDGFSQGNMPIFSAHLAESSDQGVTFSHQTLLTFLSSAADNGNSRQRVLGDYMQMKAVGGCFYGAFTGNGVPFGRPLPTTTRSSSESALLHLQGPLQRQGRARPTPAPRPTPPR